MRNLRHHISISSESRKDIDWWCEFLPSWNGVAIIHTETLYSNDIRLFTDASGIGLGGYYAGKWFSVPFNNSKNHSISFRKVFILSQITWGYLNIHERYEK